MRRVTPPRAALPSLSSRRQALREYFIEVTRDLVARGVIRHAKGQLIDDILKTEMQVVLNEVSSDFGWVLKEMGSGLLQGVGSMLGGFLGGRR